MYWGILQRPLLNGLCHKKLKRFEGKIRWEVEMKITRIDYDTQLVDGATHTLLFDSLPTVPDVTLDF